MLIGVEAASALSLLTNIDNENNASLLLSLVVRLAGSSNAQLGMLLSSHAEEMHLVLVERCSHLGLSLQIGQI